MRILGLFLLCSVFFCQDALQTKWKGKTNKDQGTVTADFEFSSAGITKGTAMNLALRKLENRYDSGQNTVVSMEANQISSVNLEWAKEVLKLTMDVPTTGIYAMTFGADRQQQPDAVIKASQGNFGSYRMSVRGFAGTAAALRKDVENDLKVVEAWRNDFQNLINEMCSYTRKEDIDAAAPDLLKRFDALFHRIGDVADRQYKPISQLTASKDVFEYGLTKIRACLQNMVAPASQKKREEDKPSSNNTGPSGSGSGRSGGGLSTIDPPKLERPKGERKWNGAHGVPQDLQLDASAASREFLKKLLDTAMAVVFRETFINILECESFLLKTATRGLESFKSNIADSGDLLKSELKELSSWGKSFVGSEWVALAGADRVDYGEISELTTKVATVVVSICRGEKTFTMEDYASSVQPAVQKLAELISKLRGV